MVATIKAAKAPNNYWSLVGSNALLPVNKAKKKIVAFSGGKDSLASLLALLEMGVPKDEIELWHHLIDGAPGSPVRFDWPCTEGYVRAVGRALGIPVRFSWKDGGFEAEMMRENAVTKGVYYEDEHGDVQFLPPAPPGSYCKECRAFFDSDEQHTCPHCGTQRDGFNTRLKYPMKTADLAKRWCSAYLKIMICKRVFANDPRFAEGYYWMLSGERREESAARAKYKEAERHGSSNSKRLVHQWRNVIDWTEEQVWDIIARWRIMPHPAYRLGWGRVSCMCCIFGDKDQWASVRHIAPTVFNWHAQNERRFALTITQGSSVVDMADKGSAFVQDAPQWLIDLALSPHYPMDEVFVPKELPWEYPAGAFKRCGGPV